MTRTPLPIAVLSCLLVWALPGHAGTAVWRCAGNAYSDTPCSEGRQLAMADDARPAADVAAARVVAARQQRLADELRAERLQREAAAQAPAMPPHRRSAGKAAGRPATGKAEKRTGQLAAGSADGRPVSPQAAAVQRPAQRPAAADTWRAVAPASRRAAG